MSATVAYLTVSCSAGGGGAGPSVEWESSAYTGSCALVTGDWTTGQQTSKTLLHFSVQLYVTNYTMACSILIPLHFAY